MKILALTKYSRLGASSRLRMFQYLNYLREHGNEVVVAPLLSDEYVARLYSGEKTSWHHVLSGYAKRVRDISRSRRKFDLVWLQSELFPWAPAFVERLFEEPRVPYVVDYDDATFHCYDQHNSYLVRRFFGTKIDSLMKRASCVVVGNAYLADRALRAGAQKVEYLPTAVDLARYKVAPLYSRGIFTIGWIGTPITASRNLGLATPAIKNVLAQLPAEFVTVGAGSVDLGIPTRGLDWQEDAEIDMVQQFDVGIMPLVDKLFDRGKCAYKLIQYMAVGKPVIGSPVGANSQVIRHGINGFLADSTEGWINALVTLYRDPALRQRMGSASRKMVESQYCTEVTAPRLLTILENARDGGSSFSTDNLLKAEANMVPTRS